MANSKGIEKIRNKNTTNIIAAFRKKPLATVNDIVSETGISRVTVSKILNTLKAYSILREEGQGLPSAQGGKPPALYTFLPDNHVAIGINYVFDHLYGCLINLNLEVVSETSFRIDPDIGKDAFINTLSDSIDKLLLEGGVTLKQVTGVGIAIPGVADLEHGMAVMSTHNPSWGMDFHIGDLIGKRLGINTSFYIDNAVRFRVMTEQTFGELKDVQDGILVRVDEGVVCGILLNNRIHRGFDNKAGEVGHMIINSRDTNRCRCGAYGCFEMQVSPESILERVNKELKREQNSVLHNFDTDKLSVDDIFTASDDGDVLACSVLRETAEWLAIGLHNLILAYDPEVIVLQGLYARASNFFKKELIERLRKGSLYRIRNFSQIRYSSLEGNSASIGAAMFAMKNFLLK